MKSIIGIGGPARAGKTTLANFVKLELERLGYTARIAPLATPIKHMVITDKSDPDKETIRAAYIGFGDKVKHMFGDDIFAALWIAAAEYSGVDFLIIDDIRYSVEAETFKEYFGDEFLSVLVDCPLDIRLNRMPAKGAERYLENNVNHPSENEWETIDWDMAVDNNREIYDLVKSSEEVVAVLCDL
jgi:dephospho-CoA kinase